MLAFAIVGALLGPAAAQDAPEITVAREEWRVVGWNDSCGVALTHLIYPRISPGVTSDPTVTRAGTIFLAAGEEKARTSWALESEGAWTWDPSGLAKVEEELRRGGFARRGFPETIRDAGVGNQPGLAETLFSTRTLVSRLKSGWPDARWRWAAADFNPLSSCALLIFESRRQRRRYRFLLTRVYASDARVSRARAHTSNARLLFEAGDLEGAAAEAAIGAALAPEAAVARYHHAALLAITGHANRAVEELAAAIQLDSKYRGRARDDRDFEDLRGRDDYKELLRGP